MRKKHVSHLAPEDALTDLDRYIGGLGFSLSRSAQRVFAAAEQKAEAVNTLPLPEIFLWALFKEDSQVRSVLVTRAQHAGMVGDILERAADRIDFAPYGDEREPYSYKEHRELDSRTRLIDLAMAIARRNLRREISSTDVLEALLEVHNESFPLAENDNWTDARLHLPHNTVSHILGTYHKVLDLRFSEVLEGLDLPERPRTPAEAAPAAIRSALLGLLQDHPDYDRNCFLVMSFASSRAHASIYKAICEGLGRLGFNVLRADGRAYADDLFWNVQTYMHGCAIGIAVFERVESEVFNPNVSFEVGYMYGLRKHVCLLKDRTLPRLPSDVAGRLYQEFDVQDPMGTIPERIERWLRDKKLL